MNTRSIVSKTLREKKDKPAPYPYLDKPLYYFQQLIDKTTLRLDENSKLICVEGAHGIGKTKLAKELAEEFEMMYMGPPDFDELYTDVNGVHWGKYQEYLPNFWKTFSPADFLQDPSGSNCGEYTIERYHMRMFALKFVNQLRAIRHILNTGQGVVLEGCAQSDYAHFNAAYQQGWMDPEMRILYQRTIDNSIREILRPNLIVYLDAPVETVQRKMKASPNACDKDSPVWNNTQYLNAIYNEYRNNFLKDIQQWSRVLVYDWSEGGDAEVVVEDIEKTELDMIEKYSDQQKDWRFHNEPKASQVRFQFTSKRHIVSKIRTMQTERMTQSNILLSRAEETTQAMDLQKFILSAQYAKGCNPHVGDKVPMKTWLFGIHDRYKAWAPLKNNLFIPHTVERMSKQEIDAGAGI